MSNTASLKKEYQDRIVPALTKEFGYKTVMQVPVLKKIVINQGLGMAAADKNCLQLQVRRLLRRFQRRISQTSSCVRKCQLV